MSLARDKAKVPAWSKSVAQRLAARLIFHFEFKKKHLLNLAGSFVEMTKVLEADEKSAH